MYIAKTV